MANPLATLESWLADPWIGGAAGALLGAIVGSFLATILIRWPQRRSALGGRSACDTCGARLGARDLAPILSFLIARGRCRACGARIDPRHLGMEIAAAMVGAAAFVAHGWPLGAATALLGWWLLLVIALDAEHHWLPDALTLPLLPFGLAVAWAGLGPPLLDRAIGAAAGAIGLWAIAALYRLARGREGMGGGDPKLLAGLGAWLGWMQLPFVLLGAGLLGLAAILMLRARGTEVSATTPLPLGALMALAAWPLWLVAAAH
ncbi:prepilin peptidase [Sphingosinicella sp.]|uniref:prepilin peptidase n=1 Tax=Sphingosinicella sp. TaxID=1917971 RepID=UPI0040377280